MERTVDESGILLTFGDYLWINGMENKDGSFTIFDMYVTNPKEQRKGHGRHALDEVNSLYKDVYASEVTNDAEEFWLKMKEEQRIIDILSYWE